MEEVIRFTDGQAYSDLQKKLQPVLRKVCEGGSPIEVQPETPEDMLVTAEVLAEEILRKHPMLWDEQHLLPLYTRLMVMAEGSYILYLQKYPDGPPPKILKKKRHETIHNLNEYRPKAHKAAEWLLKEIGTTHICDFYLIAALLLKSVFALARPIAEEMIEEKPNE